MIETLPLYKQIQAEEHSTEIRLVIDVSDNAFSVSESNIFEMKTYSNLFDGETPTVGCTVASQIDVKLLNVDREIPRMAMLRPQYRLVNAAKTQRSEWVMRGVYYIDTREVTHNDDGLDILHLTGYDAMLKAQADYPSDSAASYPKTDVNIVKLISQKMGLGNASGSGVDARTWDIMTGGYTYGLEVMGYSIQEVLSSIAIPYAGNWIITESGKLRLVSFADIPKETNLLTDDNGYVIVFGTESGSPVRILV